MTTFRTTAELPPVRARDRESAESLSNHRDRKRTATVRILREPPFQSFDITLNPEHGGHCRCAPKRLKENEFVIERDRCQ